MSAHIAQSLSQLGLLLGYLAAVSVGGYTLGRAAEILLGRLQARVIGGVLLGFAVTLPEYLFALISTLSRHNDVALGSAFGGNIFLFTLLYGVLFLANKSASTAYRGLMFDVAVLGSSTLLILFASIINTLNIYVGLALILLYALFIAYSARGSDDLRRENPVDSLSIKSKFESLGFFAVGLILTVGFIHPLVNQVVLFSSTVGIPPVITSFTLVPAGDELPELVAMFTLLKSASKRNTDTQGSQAAYANLIGSKVQSNTLLIGTILIAASIVGNPIVVSDKYTWFTLYAMVVTTFTGMFATFSTTRRSVGVLLIVVYFIIMGVSVGLGI
jgi:Ca2+/Na+ antiporter